MYSLKESMELAFQFLEDNFSPKWRTGNGCKERLIEAFSQTDIPKAEFLGYAGSDGIRHAFGRAMPNHSKPKSVQWENWLLENIGRFHCYKCKNTFDLYNKVVGKYFCKACDNKKSYDKRDERNHFVLDFLLRSKGCVDCGEKDPIVLEFDHRDPSTKLFNIGESYSSKPISAIQIELDKCDIVCANCHRRRTAKTYNHFRYQQGILE